MKIQEITRFLDKIAPPSYQESYDNVGLLVGDADAQLEGVMTTLDVSEEVIEEAQKESCNLIVAHHPVIFQGLKRLTGQSRAERIVLSAIEHRIALYAMHTNLDNVSEGLNAHAATRLGLKDRRVLRPRSATLYKLEVFVPEAHQSPLREALHEAGAGSVGAYTHCSFRDRRYGQLSSELICATVHR